MDDEKHNNPNTGDSTGDSNGKAEAERKPGATQIPLLDDIIFDESLPLKAPPKPRASKPRKPKSTPSPHYDPDTMDLFTDEEEWQPVTEDIAEDLKASAEEVIEDLVEEFSDEISKRLRAELADQLSAILNDLHAGQPGSDSKGTDSGDDSQH